MADPTWENTQPVQNMAPPQQGGNVPTWEGTESVEDRYGTLPQQALTALEGAGNAATFGAFTGLERAVGATTAKDIRMRRETNPISHGAGQVAGLMGPALMGDELPLAGSMMEGAGHAASGALGLGAEGAGVASRLAAKATQGAVETALFQGGDEISKMLSNDPHQSSQTVLPEIGLSALIGGVSGGAFGAVPEIWNAAFGDKMGQVIQDFKGRMNYHLTNPDPVGAVADELQNRYANITDQASEIYGAKGLKAQEIQSLMPEMHEGIGKQVQEINETLEKSLKSLGDDPNLRIFQKEANKWQSAVTNPEATPGDIFNATQELKQQMQEYGQFNKNIPPPVADRAFVSTAKDLGYDLRNKLEDPAIWGKSAERQQAINSSFKEYLPALKDFEKRFTVKLGTGERIIDPGKISTYMNQLGKPSAEIKQSMLQDFLNASDKYEKEIAKTHAALGIENPMEKGSLAASKATLEQLTPGARLADTFVRKGLAQAGGQTIGAAIGGALGHLVGAGGFGAIIGEHALGPFFTSILPAIAKPLMQMEGNVNGLKGAIDYGLAAVKGENLLNKTAKSLFKAGVSSHFDNLKVDEKQRAKLQKNLEAFQDNPSQILDSKREISHYLPGHNEAIAETASRAAGVLNSLKPPETKNAPLDTPGKPSQAQQASYERALDMAEQPLMILKHVNDNTISSQDVSLIKQIYPEFYQKASQKIYSQIMEISSKDEPIPYNKRQSLSIFLGEPLDSTLTQSGIAAAQMAQMQSQAQADGQKQERASKASMSGLQKTAKADQTQTQAREQARLS